MAIKTEVKIIREFDVDSSYDKVFEVLADVPFSVSHFPKVGRLVDLGDNSFRWEMDKIGIGKYSIQTIYACKYEANKDAGWIKWTPIKGVGSGDVEGRWEISGDENHCNIKFSTNAVLTLPLPRLAKAVLTPVVRREFNGMVDKYIKNLKKRFQN